LAAVVVSCADDLLQLSCRLPWLPWWMLASAATLHLRLPMCFCLPVIGSVCKGLVVEALPPVLSCCIVCVCGIVLVILGLPASRCCLVRCCLLSLNEIRATRHVRQKHLVIMMFNLCYQLLKGRRFLGPSSDEDVTDPIYYMRVRVKVGRVQVGDRVRHQNELEYGAFPCSVTLFTCSMS